MSAALVDNRLPISVVMAAYNREDCIGASLESALAQTAKPAQILVVDDGSSDATAAVAQSYPVTVLRQQNAGVSAARNAAIRAATQPWIAFHDSDDLWLPDKLALQWEALKRCPDAGIAFCDFSQFNDGGTVVHETLATYDSYRTLARTKTAPDTYCCDRASLCQAFARSNFMVTSSVIVRRDLLLSVGLFDEALRHREDYELLLRLVAVTSAACVERPLVRFRLHTTSASKEWMPMLVARSLIADRILLQPERYPSAARDRFAREQPAWLRRIGVKSIMAGDFAQAADAFSKSLARRFTPAGWLGFAFATAAHAMGAATAYRWLRTVRRRLKNSDR